MAAAASDAAARFRAAPCRADAPAFRLHRRLTDAIDCWRESDKVFKVAVTTRLGLIGIAGRTVLVEPSEDRQRLFCRFLGEGFYSYGPDLRSRLLGRDLSQQPDRAYGAWVAATWRNVLARGEPDLAEIEAAIDDPVRGPTRYRYCRVILPWRQLDGSAALTVSSTLCEPPEPLQPGHLALKPTSS